MLDVNVNKVTSQKVFLKLRDESNFLKTIQKIINIKYIKTCLSSFFLKRNFALNSWKSIQLYNKIQMNQNEILSF